VFIRLFTSNKAVLDIKIFIKVECKINRIFIDYVRNEELLLRVKEQRNILHEISKRKANWIGHFA
jgi:hypothetical protein